MRKLCALLTIAGICAVSIRARADGMAYSHVSSGGTVAIEPTAQRAVMWLRSDTWEIHIQPHFYRDQGAVAWVVPFVVRPTVSEGDADFFDQLEIVTSPVFIEYCTEDSGDSGGACGTSSAGQGNNGDSDKASSANGLVRVWERGTVGQLDYVILSAGDGDDLVQWLLAEEYEIPPAHQSTLSELNTEGSYFFVARLSQDADPALPVSPVRFALPGMNPPTYPLRMTGLGMESDKKLHLTLWIIAPYADFWSPDSHGVVPFAARPKDEEAYDDALDQFFLDQTADTFALLYARAIDTEHPASYQRCPETAPYGGCVTLGELGIDLPESWCADLGEVMGTYYVYRLEGRLTASAMIEDLTLAPKPSPESMNNVYTHDLGTCPGPWKLGCAAVGRTAGSGLLFALVMLVLLALGRRRKTRKRRTR